MDELGIFRQRADQRMLVHQGALLLGRSLAVDQGTHRPQPMAARAGRNAAGAFDGRHRMAPGQAQQPLQDTDPFDAPDGDHRFRPTGTLWTEAADLAE